MDIYARIQTVDWEGRGRRDENGGLTWLLELLWESEANVQKKLEYHDAETLIWHSGPRQTT